MNADDAQSYCDRVIQDMRGWLEQAVIGLNLCPFAKGVHVKGQIRYVVSLASDHAAVLEALEDELRKLIVADASVVDTSLLMLPGCFEDFFEFNAFLKKVERLLSRMKLEGIIQVASFHPQFQFAGTDTEDITNFSNRAPYPTLHLLREASIDRAVESFPQAEQIFGKNMETLSALGHTGWARLGVAASAGALKFDQTADKLSEVAKP